MNVSSSVNFANQDLRNRSFHGQNLKGANFSSCDLRGCDFSYAQLQGANFERVRTGQTTLKLVNAVVVTVAITLLDAHAISVMIFGILGITPQEATVAYAIALYLILALAGVSAGVRGWVNSKSRLGRIITAVSAAASGALLGFFYGGSTSNNNPQVATTVAIIAAVVGILATEKARSRLVTVVIAVAGAIAAYGFTFLAVGAASALLSVHKLSWGILWGSVSLIQIILTLRAVTVSFKEIKSTCGTSFRGADLRNAKFEEVRLESTDFSETLWH
ncbi:MAG: pentapeptide repeat-containing protein [Symploca sp. SIO3C6]|uniref:Pentapeptide repeat-containing protein n=1 Tax=Symploca sp. SIO1C4 TaxID=2607765 RepID=A0A6B3NM41_9CYAN|nr:pentapeptide repeat-containing protein [Symploca sp. SIO3C6]NER30631.1 pentapeptide repeat-containing protein [Symploca sp. SIO1C4]NET07253.1 pentapeptide repeat-containing protein [Symploca sp. SIO2B6]